MSLRTITTCRSINEYGLRAEPKYSLQQQLHGIVHQHKDVLLAQMPPAFVSVAAHCEAHVYQQPGAERCLVFWSNWDEQLACALTLPAGDALALPANAKQYRPVAGWQLRFTGSLAEPVPSSHVGGKVATVTAASPLEQLGLSRDATDYIWYSALLPAGATGAATLQFLLGAAGEGEGEEACASSTWTGSSLPRCWALPALTPLPPSSGPRQRRPWRP